MLEGLLGGDALFWIVYEYPLEEIEELPVKFGVWGDSFLAKSVLVHYTRTVSHKTYM